MSKQKFTIEDLKCCGNCGKIDDCEESMVSHYEYCNHWDFDGLMNEDRDMNFDDEEEV